MVDLNYSIKYFFVHYLTPSANNLMGEWWAGLQPLPLQWNNGCTGSACDNVLTWLSGRWYKHLGGINTEDTARTEECVRLRIGNDGVLNLFDSVCSRSYDVLCQQTCDYSGELL